MVPEVPAQALQQASQRVSQGGLPQPILIDVRTPDEYSGGHIENSINASFMPPDGFASRVNPLVSSLPKDAEIYLICLSGKRSVLGGEFLQTQGFTNVRQLQGGGDRSGLVNLKFAHASEA